MEEPYGGFGSFNPTGHAAIYLNRVCAESPTRLRLCRPGELGVVISRYHKIHGYDWLAIPLVPYLYAVEDANDIPTTADAALRAKLRDDYRRNHLLKIAPDITTGPTAEQAPSGEWTQLIGSSYDRKIYGFQIETTVEQDERLMAKFNDSRNASHFNLFFHNCADFSRVILNTYYPHAVRRSLLSDLGMTTPKQLARSLMKFSHRRPELEFVTFVIPQVPGTIPRSHAIHGVVESLVKSKKYVVPLAAFYPELTAVMAATYFTDGRFTPPKDAAIVLLPTSDAQSQRASVSNAAESIDIHSGVNVQYEELPLDDHRVDLEGGQGEGVSSRLGGSTE